MITASAMKRAILIVGHWVRKSYTWCLNYSAYSRPLSPESQILSSIHVVSVYTRTLFTFPARVVVYDTVAFSALSHQAAYQIELLSLFVAVPIVIPNRVTQKD